MMAFVLDRSKFLDTVTDAVTYEAQDPAAERMIALLENQTFLLTIPALLCDKDLTVRNKAFLALGNLIASDNRKIAQMSFGVAAKGFKYVERGFTDKETFAGAAYVLHNLAVRIRDWKELGQDHLKSLVVDTAAAKLRAEDCMVMATRDLLHTVHMIGKATDAPTEVLIQLLSKKAKRLLSEKAKGIYHTALKMLGEQISEENFKLVHVRPTYDCYRNLIVGGTHNSFVWHELLWGFSNIVVEEGMADIFLADHDVREEIITIATMHTTYNEEAEATWTLLNAVSKADVTLPPIDILHAIVDAIQTFLANYDLNKGRIYKSAQEVLEKINTEFERRFPPVDEDTESETDEDVIMAEADAPEDDYEAMWREITEECCGACPPTDLPCELPPLTPAPVVEYYPLTAVQILDSGRNYGFTSRVVAELINSVAASNGAFTPLPDNIVLTKADLAAIESRGFTIIRGNIGINSLLSTAFYGF